MKRIYTLIIVLAAAAAASVATAQNTTSSTGNTPTHGGAFNNNGNGTGANVSTGTTSNTGNTSGNGMGTTGNGTGVSGNVTTGNTGTGAGTTGNGTGNTGTGTGVSGNGTTGGGNPFPRLNAEQRFVRDAFQGNQQEILLGQLARTNSADTNVQAFGALLVLDHSAAQQQLQVISTNLGITLPSTNIRAQTILTVLSGRTGTQFDQLFIPLMIRSHILDIQQYEFAAQRAPDTAVRDYARTNLPALMDHLVVALTLRESLLGNTAAMAGINGTNGILSTVILVPTTTGTGVGTGTTGTGTGTTATGTTGTTGTGTTGTTGTGTGVTGTATGTTGTGSGGTGAGGSGGAGTTGTGTGSTGTGSGSGGM